MRYHQYKSGNVWALCTSKLCKSVNPPSKTPLKIGNPLQILKTQMQIRPLRPNSQTPPIPSPNQYDSPLEYHLWGVPWYPRACQRYWKPWGWKLCLQTWRGVRPHSSLKIITGWKNFGSLAGQRAGKQAKLVENPSSFFEK